MKYEVNITQKAQDQLEAAHEWLAEQTPQHAPEWYNAMADAIASLAEHPARCPRVDPYGDVRYLLVGDKHHAYRISFKIRGQSVYVYAIRHAARKN